MKAQAEEFFYLATILFSILLLIIFLAYQTTTKGIEVKTKTGERIINEELAVVTFALFNNKLPIVEKSYVEIGIDSILDGEKYDEVIYGKGIGKVNASEVILSFLEKYMNGRAELTIIIPKGKYTYGKITIDEKKSYTYETLIPVPEEETGKIIIRMGGSIK